MYHMTNWNGEVSLDAVPKSARWDEEIHDDFKQAIKEYVECGTLNSNGFLKHLLNNNFMQVIACVDGYSIIELKSFSNFLKHHMPTESYGSEINVACWIKTGGINGNAD